MDTGTTSGRPDQSDLHHTGRVEYDAENDRLRTAAKAGGSPGTTTGAAPAVAAKKNYKIFVCISSLLYICTTQAVRLPRWRNW